MDPEQTLRDLREAIALGDFRRAAVLFLALDEWLCRGGYIPSDWVIGITNGRHTK